LHDQQDGQWVVTLGSASLPQLVEVVTRTTGSGRTQAIGDELVLNRPTLLVDGRPIPVELNLWTICHWGPAVGSRAIDASTATAAELGAIRLDRLTMLAESATETARRVPAGEGHRWLSRWRAQLAEARGKALAKAQQTSASEPSSQVAASTEDQTTEAIARVDQWLRQTKDAATDGAVARFGEADTQFDAAVIAGLADGRWAHFVAGGAADSLRLESGHSGFTPGEKRLAGLVAIACLAAAAVWLVRRPASADWLWRWPHAAGVLLGIACWLWLSPAWIGLFIAAGSLMLMLGGGWPGRSVRVEGNTVFGSSR
jgi:hypothetical protein